ncbi:protocadherin-11 X-linked-like [Gigantopelta aegis]|uniref:protocadherin-11 X-linked-like n=1 Tax=Gigantopelta aegis TaxID=1735272 RepID=UPI001B88D5CF|nr:protocadherin-11 X-linked-like [Gigantopelta aegis]
MPFVQYSSLVIVLSAIIFRPASSNKNDVIFHLLEQKAAGSFVGNVSEASGIAKQLPREILRTLRYSFLNPNTLETASMFSINRRNGAIFSTAMIDREEVCSVSPCEIVFDVTVLSNMTSLLKIITVKIIIDDINDNSPEFNPSEVTKYLIESELTGRTIQLHEAFDRDTGTNNSVKTYSVASHNDMFQVKVDTKLDGSTNLKVIVLKSLDREKQSRYTFLVIATDGGDPQLTGTLTVHLDVTDVNDKVPQFSQNVYNITVNETSVVNSVVGVVTAVDDDVGRNAKIRYKFSSTRSSRIEELFLLDPSTGEIRVRKPLQYESGKIFESFVEAGDLGQPPLASQAKIIISVLDVGNTAPKLDLILTAAVYSDTVLLSEGSRVGTFVGHVKVQDADSGPNGIVSCQSMDNSFIVEELEGKGFAILTSKMLDRESKPQHNVSIFCSDGGSPSMNADVSFLVIVTDVNDNTPAFKNTTYYANLTENSSSSFVVQVLASDSDLGVNAELSYTLSSEASSMFSVDSHTGVISANKMFDRETVSKITFVVSAIDHGSEALTGSATVVVSILDLNDNVPEFPSTPLKLYVPEMLPPGKSIGQLSARDSDAGINSEIEYKMMSSDGDIPFVVFANGVIRTDRKLNRTVRIQYRFRVMATDKGEPPLSSVGEVAIFVEDVNNHEPIFVFPTEHDNTVVVLSDSVPGTNVSQVSATDGDEGINAKISYFIIDGNKRDLFAIVEHSGEIILNRRITVKDDSHYELIVKAQDGGRPQQESRAKLYIKITFTNSTIAQSRAADAEAKRYMIIAGVVAGVTVIISVIIVTIILFIRRTDFSRRQHAVKSSAQEEDSRQRDVGTWQDSSCEDIKAGFRDSTKSIERLYKPKMTDQTFELEPAESGQVAPDAYYPQTSLHRYGNQDFFTFGKQSRVVYRPLPQWQDDHQRTWTDVDRFDAVAGGVNADLVIGKLNSTRGCFPPSFESVEVESVTSRESTTSDSGRGGSEDDSQLPVSPRQGMNLGHLAKKTTTAPTIPPRQRVGENASLNTDIPLRHYPGRNTISEHSKHYRAGLHRSNPDRGSARCTSTTVFQNDRIQNSFTPQCSAKRVSFQEDNLAVNISDWTCRSGDTNYRALKHPLGGGVENLGSYSSLPCSVDDDASTTTSGSYTVQLEDFDDMFSHS